jgi:hypothetical protein
MLQIDQVVNIFIIIYANLYKIISLNRCYLLIFHSIYNLTHSKQHVIIFMRVLMPEMFADWDQTLLNQIKKTRLGSILYDKNYSYVGWGWVFFHCIIIYHITLIHWQYIFVYFVLTVFNIKRFLVCY